MDKVRYERRKGSPKHIWLEVQNYYCQLFGGVRYRGLGHALDPESAATGNELEEDRGFDWEALYERAAKVSAAVKFYDLNRSSIAAIGDNGRAGALLMKPKLVV